MFRIIPLSIIRSFHCTHSNVYVCHTGLLTECDQQDQGAVLILLASCQQTCMT